jgi:hypothetical protein
MNTDGLFQYLGCSLKPLDGFQYIIAVLVGAWERSLPPSAETHLLLGSSPPMSRGARGGRGRAWARSRGDVVDTCR